MHECGNHAPAPFLLLLGFSVLVFLFFSFVCAIFIPGGLLCDGYSGDQLSSSTFGGHSQRICNSDVVLRRPLHHLLFWLHYGPLFVVVWWTYMCGSGRPVFAHPILQRLKPPCVAGLILYLGLSTRLKIMDFLAHLYEAFMAIRKQAFLAHWCMAL